VDRARPEEPSKSLEEEVVSGGTVRKASPGRQEQQVAMLKVHAHASVLRNCCYFYEKNAERLICLFMSVWKHVITEGLFWGQNPVVALPLL
jgi:hypothetical protein